MKQNLYTFNLKMAGYIDMPAMPAEYIRDILEWHDSRKLVFDIYPFWLFSRIKRPPPQNWDDDFSTSFPHIKQYLIDTISPYIEIERIALLETIETVPDHTDSSAGEFNDSHFFEPVSVRVMLRNTTGDNFWLCPYKEEYWNGDAITYSGDGPNDYEKVFWKPELGRWWALNNYCCYHGSNHHDGDKKTIMTIHGAPTQKYMELLQRSKDMEGLWHPDLNKYVTRDYDAAA